ncbi:hypothetical protein DEJ48_39305 [Streptomyces venezuelae]|uniref:Uncharacterized protein n=1 Tax=Streptomyces venezuelae TaxID=54571 RepID=A0A5P2C7K2_STRVZ|nr:hypothetical protein DEJ48_39305 [Streptomyces venezuelae]
MTVGTHVYTVSLWWAAVVVWLAVSTVLLVRELMEKAQEERRSRQRSRQSAEDFFRRYGTVQGTPRQSVAIRPWTVVTPGALLLQHRRHHRRAARPTPGACASR